MLEKESAKCFCRECSKDVWPTSSQALRQFLTKQIKKLKQSQKHKLPKYLLCSWINERKWYPNTWIPENYTSLYLKWTIKHTTSISFALLFPRCWLTKIMIFKIVSRKYVPLNNILRFQIINTHRKSNKLGW